MKQFAAAVLFFWLNSAGALAPAKNISYQQSLPSQKLDVYYPQAAPPYKAVMLIHGGCYSGGDKDARDSMDFARRLLHLGYAVVNVNYRLVFQGTNIYPAALLDVEDALCWIQEHGGKYALDSGPIALMGYSAGATLANYLGTGHDSGRTRRCKAAIAGVVDFFGRTNFLKDFEKNITCAENFVGQKFDESNPSPSFHTADILTHINAATAVPVLAVHGDSDGTVNVQHSIDLCAELPGRCTLKIIQGADHMFKGPGEMEIAFASVAAFLRRKLPIVPQDETRLANLHR